MIYWKTPPHTFSPPFIHTCSQHPPKGLCESAGGSTRHRQQQTTVEVRGQRYQLHQSSEDPKNSDCCSISGCVHINNIVRVSPEFLLFGQHVVTYVDSVRLQWTCQHGKYLCCLVFKAALDGTLNILQSVLTMYPMRGGHLF